MLASPLSRINASFSVIIILSRIITSKLFYRNERGLMCATKAEQTPLHYITLRYIFAPKKAAQRIRCRMKDWENGNVSPLLLVWIHHSHIICLEEKPGSIFHFNHKRIFRLDGPSSRLCPFPHLYGSRVSYSLSLLPLFSGPRSRYNHPSTSFCLGSRLHLHF